MKPKICYLICCTERSGSNYLESGLIKSKIAGNPSEFFVDHVRKELGIDYDMLDTERLIRETMTPNGVFGARVMWGTFQELIGKFHQDSKYKEMSASTIMSIIFPNLRYIYLTRKDKVRQAISYSKAMQTNEWYKTIDGKIGKGLNRKHSKKPRFRFMEIDRYVSYLVEHDKNRRQYFHDNDIQTFSVIYEDLEGKYEQTIIELLKYMKIPITKNHDPRIVRNHNQESSSPMFSEP